MRNEFEDGNRATVHQCRDMIVFGVLEQIWCHARPQAKQEAAKVQMM
jgi:hypothetical protein